MAANACTMGCSKQRFAHGLQAPFSSRPAFSFRGSHQVCLAQRRFGRVDQRPLIKLDDLDPSGAPLAPPPNETDYRTAAPSTPPPPARRGDDDYYSNSGSWPSSPNYGNYTIQQRDPYPYQPRDQYRNTRRDNWRGDNRFGDRRGDRQGYMVEEDYMMMEEEDSEPLPDPEPEPLYVGGKRVLYNLEIEADKVRLQNETGEMMGVFSRAEAMEMAQDERVDVVCVNGEVQPPICRLVKASKYKFEWERAQKASKKKQREMQVDVKEVRLRPITDSADLDTKTRNATKFLQKGAKVKITMSFTGREQKFKEQGREVLLKMIEDLAALSTLEGPVSVRGSTFSAMLAPKKA